MNDKRSILQVPVLLPNCLRGGNHVHLVSQFCASEWMNDIVMSIEGAAGNDARVQIARFIYWNYSAIDWEWSRQSRFRINLDVFRINRPHASIARSIYWKLFHIRRDCESTTPGHCGNKILQRFSSSAWPRRLLELAAERAAAANTGIEIPISINWWSVVRWSQPCRSVPSQASKPSPLPHNAKLPWKWSCHLLQDHHRHDRWCPP